MEPINPKFKQIIADLSGKTITHVAAGTENGGVVALDFGESHTIFIHCAWRLLRYDKVLSTWNDAALPDEEDEDALEQDLAIKKLEGISISTVEVGEFFDLKIMLGKAYRLDVFCDLFSHDEVSEYEENWSVSDINDNVCFVITEDFRLRETKYNTEQPL